MKLLEGVEKVESSDFWYDLVHGGYIVPRELLEDVEDIEAVYAAIDILQEFEEVCVESI